MKTDLGHQFCILVRATGDLDVIWLEQEDDRWVANIPRLSGVVVYGDSREEAIARVEELSERVLAERRGIG